MEDDKKKRNFLFCILMWAVLQNWCPLFTVIIMFNVKINFNVGVTWCSLF